MKIALLTNAPAPYRIPVYNALSRLTDCELLVLYCTLREPNRAWTLPEISHDHVYLRNMTLSWKGRYIHFSAGVWKQLSRFSPDVVITSGFNPTMINAWAYTLIKKIPHIPMSDGWLSSEQSLGFTHKLARKVIYKHSDAFIGASRHTLDLYRHYGAGEQRLFQSPLAVDNASYTSKPFSDRKYDLMFSGLFIDRKMPMFFIETIETLAKSVDSLSILILGDGPLKDKMKHRLDMIGNITYNMPGYINQEELPGYYSDARLLLFPTQNDPWGIVANEACASGTPVLTCDNAGAANDLIANNINGYILPLDTQIWAEHANDLLNNEELWLKFSNQCTESVARYNFSDAAKGIFKACKYAVAPG